MAKKPPPVSVKQAAKIITDAASPRHRVSSLFQDFVSVMYLSLRNGVEPRDDAWQARENEYLEIVGKYDREVVDAMSNFFATVALLAQDDFADHLGEIYMSLETSNKSLGQFFTPYHVSQLMAGITVSSDCIKNAIDEHGYFEMSEPTCGSGGMVIATAEQVVAHGYEVEKHMRVTAQDIDRHCHRMTYIACRLHNIPATVIWGDTIAMEQREVAHTPALYHRLVAEKQQAEADVKDAA
ncbi:N-6 DNA methylase [Erythrobacter aureus]|nr:N-6 DNA methylase [Erythrobacter aureus]